MAETGGRRYVVLAVVIMLLAALPFSPLVSFQSSQHIDPASATDDPHLPTKDSDNDGMPDWWELIHKLNPFDAADAAWDTDHDGFDLNGDGMLEGSENFTNLMEYEMESLLGNSTDPNDPDSDRDGMSDGWEALYGLDPLWEGDAKLDSDNDSHDFDYDGNITNSEKFTNLAEFQNGTSPWEPDTDGDGMPDGWEAFWYLDPTSGVDAWQDADNDGWDADFNGDLSFAEFYTNLAEYLNDTAPRDADTDNDEMPDGWEVTFGLDPLDASDNWEDLDGDGLDNIREYNNSLLDTGWRRADEIDTTHPDLNDTDGDSLSDFAELSTWLTDPTFNDTDFDGMPDGWEVQYGLNPLDPADARGDLDNDGHDYDRSQAVEPDEYYTNLQEYLNGTDPTNPDSDNDGIPDGWEVQYGLDPLDPLDAVLDTDGDGWDFNRNGEVVGNETFTSLEEYSRDTHPDLNDTDGDGMWDGWEVWFGLNPLDPFDAGVDYDLDGHDANWNGSLESDELHTNLLEFMADTHPRVADTDGDGMWDGWEYQQGLDPNNPLDSLTDPDNDGVVNRLEYNNSLAGSNYTEVDGIRSTIPLLNDTDGDGLLDGEEIFVYFTDPTWNDTDMDGMPDGWEIRYGLDPLWEGDAWLDGDNDGYDANLNLSLEQGELFTNLEEYLNSTDPTNGDSDFDGMADGWEVYWGFDPLNNSDAWDDPDNDGLVNLHEFNNSLVEGYDENVIAADAIPGSDPLGRDTDSDQIEDGEEVVAGDDTFVTDPSNPDSDGDGMPDGWEIFYGLDPFNASDAGEDPDDDGWDFDRNGTIEPREHFTNLQEYLNGTDPWVADSDSDGMPDGWEAWYGLDPGDAADAALDLDSDGYDANRDDELSPEEKFTNLEEFRNNTNPALPDSDGDNCTDGWEVYWDEHKPANETRGFDPLDASDGGLDYDDDGWEDWEGNWHYFPNWREDDAQTDPWDADSDDDGMSDGYEADN